jgi:hypothetical protein
LALGNSTWNPAADDPITIGASNKTLITPMLYIAIPITIHAIVGGFKPYSNSALDDYRKSALVLITALYLLNFKKLTDQENE